MNGNAEIVLAAEAQRVLGIGAQAGEGIAGDIADIGPVAERAAHHFIAGGVGGFGPGDLDAVMRDDANRGIAGDGWDIRGPRRQRVILIDVVGIEQSEFIFRIASELENSICNAQWIRRYGTFHCAAAAHFKRVGARVVPPYNYYVAACTDNLKAIVGGLGVGLDGGMEQNGEED